MKRVLLCTVAVLMLAGVAFAGSAMTPQQAMEVTMNCPVCSAWPADVSQNIRCDFFTTKTACIESFMNANEAMNAQFNASAAECEKRAATIPTMAADQKAKLCPFCQARMALMTQKDVTAENFKAHNGFITVYTGTTPAAQKAVMDYAAAMKAHADLLETAAKEMGKPETMKGKM